jgi:protein-tyrosine phosphatase
MLGADSGRHIPLPGTLNFRDAGGYPVAGGGTVAWRKLLRSDGLSRLDESGTAMLARLGLRTILDLRTSYEAEMAPSPDLASHGAVTVHISLIGEDFAGLPDELGEIYDFIVDERGAAIALAVRSLASPGALPGLVHCTAGKDRTGIVIAFVLAAIGVPDEVIAADYALTGVYLDPSRTPVIGQVMDGTGMDEDTTTALLVSPPELILRALERAREHGARNPGARKHGAGNPGAGNPGARNTGAGIGGYLAANGITPGDLARLRAALVS